MSFSYIALGDSLSVGVGTSFFSPGFVHRYKKMAEMKVEDQVNVQVLAQPGFQTKDILAKMNEKLIEEAINDAEIISITAGQNDFIQAIRKFGSKKNESAFFTALENSQDNFKKIMMRISQCKSENSRPYIIRIINLYNPFPENPYALKWIEKMNQFLKNFSKAPSIVVIDIFKVFRDYEEEYLSNDKIFPNDVGYERIAEKLHRSGYGHICI